MMAVWLWLNICNNELEEEVVANMVLDEDIHNLHCKNIEIHRQQSGKYVRCRFVPKKKTLVCGMKKMSSKKHQQRINSKHCYFYRALTFTHY